MNLGYMIGQWIFLNLIKPYPIESLIALSVVLVIMFATTTYRLYKGER